ncbi:GlcNAc-PI de-N-acetylase [Marinomonas sp. S3726]|uniref:PIG-L deacetylase family protein n=1 Tax=Marinomonas sp. S3726 TaxID=579484 RepID=UPI0005FA2522|nr:PIG-L deacetylase family protein [Marinomonas sp. S3726]KJZ15968.1 GlcNAc-PI de-N-acetylase [Marinomonas sp. S3726]
MKKVLIVAPHADDETLGCGGTILKLISLGYEVHWLLVTGMSIEAGFSLSQIEKRENEIEQVSRAYGFKGIHELKLPPARLETLPLGDVIGPISNIVDMIKPEQVFTVYRNDAHSDHEIVFDAVMATTKSFRYPFIKKVIAYETMSETDFGMKPEDGGFRPNIFIDIAGTIDKKLEVLNIFESEVREFPFPRSSKALESLAYVRGAQCNAEAAEAFMLIKEIL